METMTSLVDNLLVPTESNDNVSMATVEHLSQFTFALYHVTIPVLFGVISCGGIAGNGLVIYVILSRRRMRTVINLLLLNLALADLSFALVIPPCTAYVLATDHWSFGDVTCKLMHYLVNVTAYVTVYTLVLVSVNRYLTIVHSTSTARFRTRTVTVSMIAGVWFVMGVLNSPVLAIYGQKRTGNGTGSDECDLLDVESGRSLFATFFVFGYLYPLVVIAIFSARVLLNISSHRPSSSQIRRSRSTIRKRQISRMLVVVVIVFAMLWLPVHVHLLVAFWGTLPTDETYQAVSILWYCLAYFNSCVNPLIYNKTSTEFRHAFSEALLDCCSNRCRRIREGHVRSRTRSRTRGPSTSHQITVSTLPVYPRMNKLRSPVEKFKF